MNCCQKTDLFYIQKIKRMFLMIAALLVLGIESLFFLPFSLAGLLSCFLVIIYLISPSHPKADLMQLNHESYWILKIPSLL